MKIIRSKFYKTFLVVFLLICDPLFSEAACVGTECASLPPEVVLGSNLIDPALDAVYTKEFLLSMGEAAVLQNINSSMLGGKILTKKRIGIGYSIARSNLSPRNYLFENSELRELPKQGIAASPSVNLGFNLGNLFESPSPELSKWNVHFHYFPYELSEQNVPFLKLRKTDLHGKVANTGLSVRYFPFYSPSNSTEGNGKDGLSFGFGVFQSLQTISLHSYDRRPTNVRLSGQARKWIGINDLTYNSNIYSTTFDFRYAKTIGLFSFYGGLGGMFNQGNVEIQVERNFALSALSNKDDFTTNPTLVYLDLKRNLFVSHTNWYGTVGLELSWRDANIMIEYLKNKNSESVSLGVFIHF
ncbi:Lsa36 family surface (lipo)protein [Leptospira adleri]|uniref:Porin n=1 Tax=Leptospira adleri TaxID=2023186 RepID=A0A2M9YR83_9LEPT|nr:hypothetical protein [Leptospira adleri]PJZ54000.1 hypothetical protein CH380_05610 [Leptospira adleri]PJZ63324.1 hypothetical protein CH376_03535 [Leptospira adleri]